MLTEERRQELVTRFEAELGKVERPGMDALCGYIRKSDFYTAPASTRFHLSCRGGLLQHSLNVLDALRSVLRWNPTGKCWEYVVAGKILLTSIPDESVTIIALLYDICKTYFYAVSMRNAKNEQTGEWEKVPYYTVKDRMPLGHGAKSAMIVKQYIPLTNPEMYGIWHHMGITDGSDTLTFGNAVDIQPIVWAVHTADMMASHFMEDKDGNRELFALPSAVTAGEWGERLESGEAGFDIRDSDVNADGGTTDYEQPDFADGQSRKRPR